MRLNDGNEIRTKRRQIDTEKTHTHTHTKMATKQMNKRKGIRTLCCAVCLNTVFSEKNIDGEN